MGKSTLSAYRVGLTHRVIPTEQDKSIPLPCNRGKVHRKCTMFWRRTPCPIQTKPSPILRVHFGSLEMKSGVTRKSYRNSPKSFTLRVYDVLARHSSKAR